MERIGIVLSEGGISCAYSVGAMKALLAYFTAGQFDSIINIWENLLSTKKFISFFRLKVIDIDYLIDTVFRKQDPLDTQKVKASPIKLFIATTDAKSGKLQYFSNRDNQDIFEVLRASSAMPIAYNKRVKIGDREYIDGAVAGSLMDHIAKAKGEGAEKIIVINNSHQSRLGNFLLTVYFFLSGHGKLMRKTRQILPDNNVLLIEPSRKLAAGALDNERRHILKTIETGYNDIVNNRKLKAFLQKS